MGDLTVEGNTRMRNALYMSGKNISQINELQFSAGGNIRGQSSNSNIVIAPSYNLVLNSRGSTALMFDSTHGYMQRTLSMEGNSITNQSDERLKRNIMPSLKDSLGKFSKLEFTWFEYLENRGLADGLHHGVIAQDVLKFAPEWVVEDEQGYYSLNQSAMLMDAFKAIMQLSKKVKKLEAK